MRLRRTVQESIRETFYAGKHRSGLEVLVNPKPGFSRKLAILGTRFGSVDNRYRRNGDVVELPDGLAHFLEHQLFTKKDGDVFERFARTGASANAGTGFTQTTYYFSCTRAFATNLGQLLRFVYTPYFSSENVIKEQGIIGQEIVMYQDSAEWRVFMDLLAALYAHHPIRIDIAGTVESIAHITPDVLDEAYRTFYHPSNMVLVVAGDVDPTAVAAQVERVLGRKRFPSTPRVERLRPEEPHRVHKKAVDSSLVIAQPKLLLGFKDRRPPAKRTDLVRREVEINMLLQMMFGRGTELYQSLYREGLIDDSFGASYSADVGFGFTVLGGDTDRPERLEEAIRQGVRRARRTGIRREDLRRIRRKLLGKFFFGVNSPESTAMTLMSFWMKRCQVGEYPDILRRIRLEHLEARLAEHFDPRGAAVSRIRPRKGSGGRT